MSAYISSVVRSTSIDALRRAGREARHLAVGDYSDFANVPDNAEAAEERLLRLEKQKIIRSALRRISRADRAVLEGKYLVQLSDDELGKILNVTPAAVRMRLTRARKRARVLFASEKSLVYDEKTP